MGALNPSRLKAFQSRYEEIPKDQPRFLYGTHYSTPGYVLYYMVPFFLFLSFLLVKISVGVRGIEIIVGGFFLIFRFLFIYFFFRFGDLQSICFVFKMVNLMNLLDCSIVCKPLGIQFILHQVT